MIDGSLFAWGYTKEIDNNRTGVNLCLADWSLRKVYFGSVRGGYVQCRVCFDFFEGGYRSFFAAGTPLLLQADLPIMSAVPVFLSHLDRPACVQVCR